MLRLRLLAALLVPVATLVGQNGPATDEANRVARGLAAIQADHIRADVEFLACDDMAGRDTPSAGQRLAARFIRNRVERLGWRHGARDGWFHSFPLVQRRLDTRACSAVAERENRRLELELGRDYSFSPLALASFDVSGGVVYFASVNDGEVTAAADVLRGKWALVAQPIDDTAEFEDALRAAGALGSLTSVSGVNGAADDGGPGVVFDIWGSLMQSPSVSRPDARPFLPRVYLPRATIEGLLELAGVESGAASGQDLPIRFTEARQLAEDQVVEAENVLAWWPAEAPVREGDPFVVSAHYDHVGLDRRGQVCNGADDNASGSAALLALAEALAAHGPLDRPVLLAWFAGEENGLWGSEAFVADAWYPEGARPVANINLDMLGRNAPDQIELCPSAEHPARNAFAALAEALAPEEGFTSVVSGDGFIERSDQWSFARRGIPVLFLSTGLHEDYHEPTDDSDKLDADKIGRAARLVFKVLVKGQSPSGPAASERAAPAPR